MKIVVNGDSFTHERHFAVGEDYKEKTWANSIGAENIAFGGCSNERIFYSTIQYLINNKPDVLIIGWTDYNRHLMTHTNGLHLHITPSSAADDLLYGFNEQDKSAYAEYYEFYYKKMLNEFLNFKKFLTYYLHLEQYCRVNEIKFLNFMVFHMPDDSSLEKISASAYMSREDKDIEAQGIKYHYNILKKELTKFKKENWINNEIGFSYSKHVEHLPKWPDGHPGLEASALWAKLIKKNLKIDD
jgi:hypothetical protein